MAEKKSARRRAPNFKAQLDGEAAAVNGRLGGSAGDRFAKADEVMGIDPADEAVDYQVKRQGFAAPLHEMEAIDRALDKCLDKREVLSRSDILRVALYYLDTHLSAEDILRLKRELPVLKGGPRGPRKR